MKSFMIHNGRPYMDGRSYLLVCEQTRDAAIIDPDGSADSVRALLEKENLRLAMILLTHGHFDHIGSVSQLRVAYGAPVYIHRLDADMLGDAQKNLSLFLGDVAVKAGAPDGYLEDGQRLTLGKTAIQVLHTPGHTPGSCCFLWNGGLYSGDLLFRGGVGRTDFPGGDAGQLSQSLRRVLRLPPQTPVYPGHGEPTTVGEERNLLDGEGSL